MSQDTEAKIHVGRCSNIKERTLGEDRDGVELNWSCELGTSDNHAQKRKEVGKHAGLRGEGVRVTGTEADLSLCPLLAFSAVLK